jgi:type I restriction enzyme S subunit
MSGANYLEKPLDGVEVEWTVLGDERFVEVANAARRPVKASLRVTGDTPYYGANNIQDYVDGHTHDGEYVLIAEDGSASLESYSIQYATGKFWANNHVHVVRGNQGLNTRFLYHYLRIVDFIPYLPNKDRSKLTKGEVIKIPLPIPCPDNPKKSLEIQAEIVRILDAFIAMTAELTAELNLRKKQYNHYRDQLLSFEEGEVEWKPLGEVCDFKNGFAFKSNLFKDYGLPIVRITNVNGTSVDLADVKYFNPDDYKENTQNYIVNHGDILIAMSGATTGKIGYFDNSEVAYLNQRVGKFVPNSGLLDNRFLYHFLLSKTEAIYVLAGGGAQPNLSSKVLLEKLLVPIPHSADPAKSIAEQKRIADILDKLDTLTNSITEGLPREIELRQKQYEYYRDLLLSFPKPEEVAA